MKKTLTRAGFPALILALAPILAACGPDSSESTTTETTGSEFAFGSPAEAADADRVIEIETNDALRFEPADITVGPGETVTFRLTNDGSVVHDFTLGDQATQDEHEAEMSEMNGMAHDEPNVATIPAGETAEFTGTFDGEGTVLIGCHQPGHYAAGMTGQITVEG
ncbi:MAG TPA: plastocyanin/azurin family copper-binding protein [Acidimicrobiia bacterium]|nr:plastocyanin/azurin family copper-binding protein [Acidimicrobiia bacterium]